VWREQSSSEQEQLIRERLKLLRPGESTSVFEHGTK
jgi:hypothetical protein